MDEFSAAEIREDGAENKRRHGDGASVKNVESEDSFQGLLVFCCQDCGETFREETSYLEHQSQHPHQTFTPNHQSTDFKRTDNGTGYHCTLCSISFVEINELDLHMKVDHVQNASKNCGLINSNAAKLLAHVCSICGKSYSAIGNFLNHQRSHRQPSKSLFHGLEDLKKKSFQCETCGRSYSRASALDAHRRCHEEKLIKSRSRRLAGVGQHGSTENVAKPAQKQMEEDSNKPFRCLCGKTFSKEFRLKSHQRLSRQKSCGIETKEIPISKFPCSECNKVFRSHTALKNHHRWHTKHLEASGNRFPCEECGKVFMTLTFYYRHQRTAHSDETPAKSFLHQVCQLQKKAFECKVCGLKFSRESALHSHELQHTEDFGETEKEARASAEIPLYIKEPEVGKNEAEPPMPLALLKFETRVSPNVSEKSHANEADDDSWSYEPGDFNVQVISASESEDETSKDPNPDLELLCESDHEGRDVGDLRALPKSMVSKSEVGFKIVQIDSRQIELYELMAQDAEGGSANHQIESMAVFPSLPHAHRTWHDESRSQAPSQSVTGFICDPNGHEPNHIETRLYRWQTQESRAPFQCSDCMLSFLHASSLCNHKKTCKTVNRETSSLKRKEYNPNKTLLGPKNFHCERCGKGFWSLGAYSHHRQNRAECENLRLRKGAPGGFQSSGRSRSCIKVACPVCGRKFRHKGIMALHMRKHENGSHTCDLCGRTFRLFSSLLRHQVVHRDQMLPPPIKSFQHQMEQLKKNNYSCKNCGKLFSRAKALQFHMKSHGCEARLSPSPPRLSVKQLSLKCYSCSAKFSSKVSLKAHQKICTKDDGTKAPMKYKCNKCDRSFSVVGALNFHKRIHTQGHRKTNPNIAVSQVTNIKQEEQTKELFACLDCGRHFPTNSALGSHKRWQKEKGCSLGFKTDKESLDNKSDEGPFQCNKCEKQFFNQCVLHRHQLFNHQFETKTELDSKKSNAKTIESPKPAMIFDQNLNKSTEFVKDLFEPGRQAAESQGNHLLGCHVTQHDGNITKKKSSPPIVKPKPHQCLLCPMTFSKARGLRAHKWQAHSKGSSKNRPHHGAKVEPAVSKTQTVEMEQSEERKACASVEGIEETSSSLQMENFVLTPDARKQTISPVTPKNFEKASSEETQSPEDEAESPMNLSCVGEQAVKCFFKCDNCGKAFPAEEQLASHKAKAKSRPYTCALCCHSFWAQTQLQQHLIWHDQVRKRLPNELRFRLHATGATEGLQSALKVTDKTTCTSAGTDQPTPGTLGGIHICQRCRKAFLSPTSLQAHQLRPCSQDLSSIPVGSKTINDIRTFMDRHLELVSPRTAQSDTRDTGPAGYPTASSALYAEESLVEKLS